MGKRVICLLCCLSVWGSAGVALGELVGHWKLDETEGTKIVDSSGKGHDGTLAAGKLVPGVGVKDGALEFQGLGVSGGGGDYFRIENTATLDISGALSIALWIRPGADDPEGKATTTAPMAKALSGASPSWSYQVRYGWNSNLKPFMAFTFNTTPRAWAFVDRKLERDEWCHIACSYNGTTLTTFLNGLATESTPMGPITKSPTPVLIGSDGWGCDWIGAIDDVRIYNNALTADEIAELCPPSRAAKNPTPADGAVGVATPLFRWEAGYKGVMHEVYFGTTPDLGPADLVQARMPVTMYWHIPALEPGKTYYWRVDEIEADGVTVHSGSVWSFTAQGLTAYAPTPADGANNAPTAPQLVWLPGQAAVEHHVYFGTDKDAVAQGVAGTDKGKITETTFAPGDLDDAQTYFWRVDEIVAGGEVKAGVVWSFTTILPVEDFESYTDDEGQRIYEAWIDGWTNKTGSTVGYTTAPFAEQKVVHGGQQSMPLDYNNVNAPFYSEAEYDLAPAQDWTVNGVDTLVLHVRGRSTNGAAPLYVILRDANNRTATVSHPDPAVVTVSKWTEWKIPLSDFAGVNAARIKQIVIGIGDKSKSVPGAAGLLFMDDIYVIRNAAAN
jgi:hypothetical protein